MKIDLTLSDRQLNTLVYCFSFINQFYPKTRKEKSTNSILVEVILKVKKKYLEVEAREKTLFTKAKITKFSFKYYEADCLEQYLLLVENQPLNDYDKNALLFIKNKLNQKLA